VGLRREKQEGGSAGDESPPARGPGGARALPVNKTAERFLHAFLGGFAGDESPQEKGQRRAEGSERGEGFPLRIVY
jgi:hypothetical protein